MDTYSKTTFVTVNQGISIGLSNVMKNSKTTFVTVNLIATIALATNFINSKTTFVTVNLILLQLPQKAECIQKQPLLLLIMA